MIKYIAFNSAFLIYKTLHFTDGVRWSSEIKLNVKFNDFNDQLKTELNDDLKNKLNERLNTELRKTTDNSIINM